jgi:hypothetical protein
VTSDEVVTEETSLEQANTEVVRLEQGEKDILARFLSLRQELPIAREEAGDAILDSILGGKATPKSGSQLTVIQGELEALKAAEVAAQRQRVEAIKQVWKLQSQDDRDKASRLRQEADDLDERALPLIAELSQLWGMTPTTPATGINITSSSRFISAPTKAQSLRNEAAVLERNAAQRETQPVSRNGHFEFTSEAEPPNRLHENPFHVGCSAIAALEWVDRARQMEEERRSKVGFQPAEWPEMVFVLHYRDSVIDERESRAYTPPLY